MDDHDLEMADAEDQDNLDDLRISMELKLGDLQEKLESLEKELERLTNVKDHLINSYDARFVRLDRVSEDDDRPWRRAEVVRNTDLIGRVMVRANRFEGILNRYLQAPPILDGVDTDGLKIEHTALANVRKQVLADVRKWALEEVRILIFTRLLEGWPSHCIGNQQARSARDELEGREPAVKTSLFDMLLFLRLFFMENKEHEQAFTWFVGQLRRSGSPGRPLIRTFVRLLQRQELAGMENLRRMTRNTLNSYRSMGFLVTEVRELMEEVLDRMQLLDIAFRDIF